LKGYWKQFKLDLTNKTVIYVEITLPYCICSESMDDFSGKDILQKLPYTFL